jgi:hypothetical protein
MNITTARDCTWSITGVPAWVAIAGQTGGQGEAVISYAVSANPAPVARDGSISVGNEAVQVKQAAAPCTFTLDRRSDTVSATGGRIVVDVTTLGGCNWSVVTDVPWVTISSGRSGNTTGTVGLDVAANGGPQRVATVRVGGESFALTQSQAGEAPPALAPPGAAPAPPNQPPPAPPPPIRVQVEGTVKSMSGECPSLIFTVSGRRVATSRDTRFVDTSCRDLQRRPGRVRATGFERADGIVDAFRIETLDKNTDDDKDNDDD